MKDGLHKNAAGYPASANKCKKSRVEFFHWSLFGYMTESRHLEAMEVYNTSLRKGIAEEGVEFQLDTQLQWMTFCTALAVPTREPPPKRVSDIFTQGNSCAVWGRPLPQPQKSSSMHLVLTWGSVRAAMGSAPASRSQPHR